TMQDISKNFFYATQTAGNNEQVSSLSWNLIQENVADLLYISSQGFSTLDNKENKRNELTPDSFKITNLNALITSDTIDDVEGEEVKHLAYKLDTNENGKVIADKIKGGVFAFFNDSFKEGYFRYHANFTPMIIGLAALLVAYVFTLFIFVTTIIEIGFKKVVGLFVFATDLENGQRTKMVVQDILNAFLLIAFTGLSLKMYTVFLSFLASKQPNIFIYVIAIISSTFVLIKGSNTIMRYFGVDVGLKEGFGQLVGAFALGRATTGGFKRLKNLGNSKNNDSNNTHDQNVNKDRLNNQSNNNKKSINDSVSGNNKNRNQLGDFSKEKLSSNGLSNSINSDGKMEGLSTAAVETSGVATNVANALQGEKGLNQNKQSLNSNNELSNDPSSSIKRYDTSNNGQELQEKNAGDNATITPTNQRQTLQQDVISSVNDRANGKTQSNEEILAEMKLKESLNPNGNVDVNAASNMRLTPENKSINQQSSEGIINRTRQEVAAGSSANHSMQDAVQNMKANTVNSAPLKQSIEQDVKSVPQSNHIGKQSIVQDIQSSNGQAVSQRQTVIQDVQNSSETAPNRQRVVQEIEQAKIATPQQIQQNVQQVLTTARLPQEAHQTVKRVIEDVQKQGNIAPETLKMKVVQELEKTSFGAKEPIKQVILQDVQKAFSSTPEPVQQSIKQIVESTQDTKKIGQPTENKKVESSYFGSLFGEKVSNYEKGKTKKGSR
ncbi:pLS20_p028 family conjugation system transmembrane protein, partial [Priestia megaterium]